MRSVRRSVFVRALITRRFADLERGMSNGRDAARQHLGVFGENLIVDYLQQKGFSIVARNWRLGRLGEMDIIARSGATDWVFVEVKTRHVQGEAVDNLDTAFGMMTEEKIARMHQVAQGYLDLAGCAPDTPYRLDLMVVGVPSKGSAPPRLWHYENIGA